MLWPPGGRLRPGRRPTQARARRPHGEVSTHVSQRRGRLGLRQRCEPGRLPHLPVLLGEEVATLGRTKQPAVLGGAELFDVDQADAHQVRPRHSTAHLSTPHGPQSGSPSPMDMPCWQRRGRIEARSVTPGRSGAGTGAGLRETHVTGVRSAYPPPWLTFGGSGQNSLQLDNTKPELKPHPRSSTPTTPVPPTPGS